MIYAAFLVVTVALFATMSWRDLRVGLFLLSAALPTYLLRFEIAHVPMTLLEALIVTFVAVWAAKTKPSITSLIPTGWTLPIALLLVAATVGVAVSPDRLGALGVWKAYFVEPILLFLVVSRMEKPSEPIFRGLAAGGLFVAACAIAQRVTGLGIPVPWDVEGRVTSVFPYPNAVGLLLGPVIVVGVVESLSQKVVEWRKTIFFLGTAAICSIAIVLSQSEAAIVAVLATLFVAAIATKRTRKAAVAVAVVATVLITASPFRQTVVDKLTFRDYSGNVRRSQWEETWNMLSDRPIFGAGLNGYQTALAPYHTHPEYEIFQYPHQIALNTWTELGLLGLVAFAL
ncbi:O-antigen ligase family protein, partial [bacterium]|nr:O-antigen ligase family protein [bacterium]